MQIYCLLIEHSEVPYLAYLFYWIATVVWNPTEEFE